MTRTVDAKSSRLRKMGGIVLIICTLLVGTRWFKGSWPREHALVFRLPEFARAHATRLSASFTPVGESEPARGLSVTLVPPNPRDIHDKMSLPDGDYIILLELTYGDMTGPSAPAKSETSRARRVSLTADETLVVFEAEGSE